MPWVYDSRVGKLGGYRDTTTGRFVSEEMLPVIVNADIDNIIGRVSDLASAIARGDIAVDAWLLSMRARIKEAYITQAILAVGGRDRMTQAYWGAVGGRIYGQYRYLDNFARQLAVGRLTEGQINSRATMYINSARQVFWAIRTRMAKAAGYSQEQWITKGDENVCEPCDEAGEMGWQPLGTFAEPGSGTVMAGETYCEGLTRCRCEKEYE